MSDVLMVSPARLGESARPGETGTCSHEGTPVRMPSSQICFPTLVVKSFSVWSHAKWVWPKRCSLKRLGACGILPTTRCSCSRRQHQTELLQIRLAALKKKRFLHWQDRIRALGQRPAHGGFVQWGAGFAIQGFARIRCRRFRHSEDPHSGTRELVY